MDRNLAKKNSSIKPTSGLSHWRWIISIGTVAVMLCGASFFAQQQKKESLGSSVISPYISRFNTWVVKNRGHLHQGVVKVKQLASNKHDAEPQIHFEFYTALPNMQVPISESAILKKNNDRKIRIASNNIPAAKRLPEKNTPEKNTIANAAELERELFDRIKHQ